MFRLHCFVAVGQMSKEERHVQWHREGDKGGTVYAQPGPIVGSRRPDALLDKK